MQGRAIISIENIPIANNSGALFNGDYIQYDMIYMTTLYYMARHDTTRLDTIQCNAISYNIFIFMCVLLLYIHVICVATP